MSNVEHIIPGTLLNDPPMPAEDLARIHVLDEGDAKERWDSLVDPGGGHLWRLPMESWPRRTIVAGPPLYEYHDDWNADRVPAMQRLLAGILPPESTVFVFWMRPVAARTVHDVLCRNWMNFLFDDEGVVIRSEADGPGAVLASGRMWFYTNGA
ncbi:MAG: DUF2947 family protein [Phycisphaerales bacterium]|nr:DUF2947 family protein [Phycisphaerales bacterium]